VLMLQNPKSTLDISPNDLVSVIFGKEHLGWVRGLSCEASASPVFKRFTTRLSGINDASSITPSLDVEDKVIKMETACNSEGPNVYISCLHCY